MYVWIDAESSAESVNPWNTKSPVNEGYFEVFPNRADFLPSCFNDWSKVWRLALATRLKISSWKFVGPLLCIAKNNFNFVWPYLFLENFENLSQKLIWAGFQSFCFNNCSKVRRLALALKMKILSWKYVWSYKLSGQI